MSVTINGETVYPQTIIDLVRTPDGLRKILNYLESKKVEQTAIEEGKK